MFELIFKAIITILNPVASLLIVPLNTFLSLIPGVSDMIGYVTSYMNNILQFVPLCLDFLMIPRQAVVILFDYYVIKYLLYIALRGIKFAITLYNKLKP